MLRLPLLIVGFIVVANPVLAVLEFSGVSGGENIVCFWRFKNHLS
jgi:hypothetical protein